MKGSTDSEWTQYMNRLFDEMKLYCITIVTSGMKDEDKIKEIKNQVKMLKQELLRAVYCE